MIKLLLSCTLWFMLSGAVHAGIADPQFGDDAGQWANDGECDDPRFGGTGLTDTALLEDDILHDASDCRAAYRAGTIRLVGFDAHGTLLFGDDASDYARDGECDDARFEGRGMSPPPLIIDDLLHDASDCRAAFERGTIRLR